MRPTGLELAGTAAQILKAQKSMPYNFQFEFIFFTKEVFCSNFKSLSAHAERYGKVPEIVPVI